MLAGCGGGGSGVSTLPSPAKHAGSIAAPVASPAPVSTVYIGDVTKVYAFPLGGDGTLAPSRTIAPHPEDATHSLAFDSLATGTDGSLFVLDNYFTGPNNSQTEFCRILQYGPEDSGSPAVPEYYPDPNFETASQGEGIARNTQAGFDFAFRNGGAGGPYGVSRFGDSGNGISGISTLPMPSGVAPVSLATDRGGHDYLDALGQNGRILEYASTTTDPAMPTRDYTVSGSPKLGALAVSQIVPKTIYAVVMPSAGGIANEKIIALAPGATTPSRTLGPFPNHYITAMAVDSQGLLYVAMNPVAGGTGASIRVYASNAVGTPVPVRHIIPNPAITEIRGLAIFE
ncbi:MAG TPA: hypothetical protein VN224_05020 [Xanthomonadales bacterium]|nr:hypothetical protein [Xanthomonadales bacterium]